MRNTIRARRLSMFRSGGLMLFAASAALVSTPAIAVSDSTPQCDELLARADRLDGIAADIDRTGASMKAAQARSVQDAALGRLGEYLNIAKSAVDASCGIAQNSNPAVKAACFGWKMGTSAGEYSNALQEAKQGSIGGGARLACKQVAGEWKGACTQASGVTRALEGDAAGATERFIDGKAELIADTADSIGKKGVAKAARVVSGAAQVAGSAATLAELNNESNTRADQFIRSVQATRQRAAKLRELGRALRTQQCKATKDRVAEVKDRLKEALSDYERDVAASSSSPDRSPSSSVKLAAERVRLGSAQVEASYRESLADVSRAATSAALQMQSMSLQQQAIASSNSGNDRTGRTGSENGILCVGPNGVIHGRPSATDRPIIPKCVW